MKTFVVLLCLLATAFTLTVTVDQSRHDCSNNTCPSIRQALEIVDYGGVIQLLPGVYKGKFFYSLKN